MQEELKHLLGKIADDFVTNYKRKIHNWTLKEFDKSLVAHMVFVSSFESKSGNMFQNIAKRIAKLRYGDANIPKVICGKGVNKETFEEFSNTYTGNEQIIMTAVNQRDCQEFIAGFRERHKAKERGSKRTGPTLNQEALKEINKQKFTTTETFTAKPVDLVIYDDSKKEYYLMEIKAGGDLDSSNAPGNINKMLTEYALLGKDNVKLYFATLYNKNGEGNTWTGIVKQYIAGDMLLIGKNFWEIVLPKNISFDKLTDLYSSAVKELEINKTINDLIKDINNH